MNTYVRLEKINIYLSIWPLINHCQFTLLVILVLWFMNGRRSFELYKTARCYYWLRRHKTSPPKQSKLPRYKYSHVEWLGPGSLEKKIWASLSPQTVTHIMQEFSANRIALGFLCLMRGVLKDAKQSQKNCLPPLCHRVLCKCAADRTHKNHSEAASYMFFFRSIFPLHIFLYSVKT